MTTERINQATPPTDDNIVFYELEKVRFVLKDATGLDIAYAYQDLIFSEHALFIIQFDGTSSSRWNCWFNNDCTDSNRHTLFRSLTTSAILNGITLHYKGKFTLSQADEKEEISIHFTEA
jgi:hypothetical protein